MSLRRKEKRRKQRKRGSDLDEQIKNDVVLVLNTTRLIHIQAFHQLKSYLS